MKVKNKVKIKKIILKSRLLSSMYYARLAYKSSEFRQWLLDNRCSRTLARFNELGPLNPQQNILYMRFDNSAWGFFAYWRFSLIGLYFADRYNFKPVIDWTENSPYYEENGVNGIFNPFEYYYQPVSEISPSDAQKSMNVTYYSYQTTGISFSYSQDTFNYVPLCKKHIKLREDIEERLDVEINNLLKGKKTIAVHVRGVEWGNISGHPIPIGLDEYILKIKEALSMGFEQIFLATDSEKTLKHMKKEFGDCLVYYEDAERTKGDSKTLVIFDESKHEIMRNFNLGYQVLRDMQTMSYCQGLIAGLSNVSLAARVTKEARDEKYEYSHIFEQELKTRGVNPQKAEKLMRSGKFK